MIMLYIYDKHIKMFKLNKRIMMMAGIGNWHDLVSCSM